MIITGHSLGGGLAKIVGYLASVTNVGFSPPGIALSYKKYKIPGHPVPDRLMLHHHSISIVPENDAVPMVDVQVCRPSNDVI